MHSVGGASDSIDVEIGRRIREARRRSGLSQVQLGARLNLTPHQLQRYERGLDRLSAPGVVRTAAALEVAISFLLPSLDSESCDSPEPLAVPEAIDDAERLIDAFDQITSSRFRRLLVEMAEGLADKCRLLEQVDG